MVTVLLPFENTGALAKDRLKSTLGEALVGGPNQYRGRYISSWNWVRFVTEKYVMLAKGKIQVGFEAGDSAQ
jgi:hypothetical protein